MTKNAIPKLTGPQITALKLKFTQLLKEGAKHQYAHYEELRRINQRKATLREDAIRAQYQPAITALVNKIDTLYAKKREIEKKRDAAMLKECDKLFGPQPRIGSYQVERVASEHWTSINLKLQFANTHDTDALIKMLSDEVVKILNAKE